MTKISNTIKVKTGENSFEDEIKVSYIEPNYSAAEGKGTIASSSCQHVEGKYNIEDTENKYIHIAGNGNDDTGEIVQSNAHTLDWDGNAWFAGDITCGENNSKLMQMDLLWKNEDPTSPYQGSTPEEAMNSGRPTTRLSFNGKPINIRDYSGFFITNGYSSSSALQATPISTVFIPSDNWTDLYSTTINEDIIKQMPSVQLKANKWYSSMRRVYFVLQDDIDHIYSSEGRIEILIDHGNYYKTYGTSTATQDDSYCIPLTIYGVRNINK